MSYALVFLIGLVASISTCIAVTGGLLVAVAAKYHEASGALTGVQRLRPLLTLTQAASSLTRCLGGYRRTRLHAHALFEDQWRSHHCRQRGDDPARLANAKTVSVDHAIHADDAENSVHRIHDFAERETREALSSWERQRLFAVRIHSSVAIVRPRQSRFHDWGVGRCSHSSSGRFPRLCRFQRCRALRAADFRIAF